MRSVKAIKLRLRQVQGSKGLAFKRGNDFNYRLYSKTENLLKWILDKDHNPKKRKRGKRIKTDEKNM